MMLNSNSTGEIMVGFLIDKLDRVGNQKLQQALQDKMKKALKWKKPAPTIGEFNTFMIGSGKCEYLAFDNAQKRVAAERVIQALYQNYAAKNLKSLQIRTKRNRSELEAHKTLAKFLKSMPNSPNNPESLISRKNRQVLAHIRNMIARIIDCSTIIFWSFNGVGDERIIVHDGVYQRRHKQHSITHAFDELLVLNFTRQFLASLEELSDDICTSLDLILDSLTESTEIPITVPELASEAFKILIGDAVRGIDAFRTMIRQISRIEAVFESSQDEMDLLSDFGEDFLARISKAQHSNRLKINLQQNLEILEKIHAVLRKLEKEALKGKIQVKIGGFHKAVIDLPIQLRKAKIWADRFMDVAYLAPEAGGVAIDSNQEEIVYDRDEDSIVEAIGLHKTYYPSQHTVYALRGVSLKIKRGEFVAILGPSGTGKTTLINIMAGLDVPDRGKVYLNGRDISKMSDDELSEFRRRQIGFVFQQYILDPRLNVYENVALPALMAKNSNNLDNRVHEMLSSVGIGEYASQIPTKLSGGQMQRLIIARACINLPLVVFADEPTGDLDSETGKQVMAKFRQLCDEKGIAIVLVTHDKEMADFADRSVHMIDGQVIA